MGLNHVATRLDPLQVKRAEEAYAILHEAGYLDLTDANTAERLVRAAKWYTKNYRPESAAPTVAEFKTTFLNRRAHRDPRTKKITRAA